MKKVLLLGIAGVYNYGCEAIVRGTERILHHWYPSMQVLYASSMVEADRRRLLDCPVKLVPRRLIGRYHPKAVTRKLLSQMGVRWSPMRDRLATADGCDAVLSIGGDLYTLHNGVGPESLMKFGDACQRQGVPYVLWSASVGPFEAQPSFKARATKHLAAIHRITAREDTTVDYLAQLGVTQNVVRCADPAFVVAPEIVSRRTTASRALRIGINLSPLSALHCGFTVADSAARQATAIERLLDTHAATIVLLPHVVCETDEADDDRRYLARVRDLISPAYRSRVQLVDDDPGFIGIKHHLTECDLVIAARMHCAINAVAAQVPALILAYSQKAVGMGRYIHGNDHWTMPLAEISPDALVGRVAACLNRLATFHAEIPARLAQIRAVAFGSRAPL